MIDGKWIDGLHADMPALEAARQVLALRFKAVAQRVPQALHESEEDVEHVHQLRVSTRRAAAALRIFRPLLPKAADKKLRRQLRHIRSAAGAARDWDVFIEDIAGRLAEVRSPHKPGLDLLLGIGHGQRSAAQGQLVEAVDDPSLRLDEAIDEALAGLCLPDDLPQDARLLDLAVPHLLTLLRDLDLAASGDLTNYEHLHQVRILGKQLRYAMEVFESCFAPAFRGEHYPAIEEMQEILGKANDSFVAAQRLEGIKKRVEKQQPSTWKRYRTGINALIKWHQARLVEQRAAFEEWWQHWHATGGELAMVKLAKTRSAG